MNIKISSRTEQILERPLFQTLTKRFEKGFSAHLDHFNKTISGSLDKLEVRLNKCDKSMRKVIQMTHDNCEKDLQLAEELVNKELRSKVIMSQWTNKFLSESKQTSLDPITFALTRFSLNICLTYSDVSPDYILKTNIHKQLLSYASLENDLVVGPALTGLVHVSLSNPAKPEIVAAGALPILLKILVHSESKIILTQACKLCASLALHQPNKTLISYSGCMHSLFDLIVGVHRTIDRNVQYATLNAIVNVVHQSDANRMLSVELNGIKPILYILRICSHEDILVQCLKGIANIAFNNSYCANCILIAGGGEVLVEVLDSHDILRKPLIAHAALAALANICNNEVNQSHVGAIKGLVEIGVRVCNHARELYLVNEAANFLLACCWKNTINKARIANCDGCVALVKRIIRHGNIKNKDDILCTERLCFALSSVLLYSANHERMNVIGGLEEMVRLCRVISEPIVLRGISRIISTMIPSAIEILRLHEDDTKHISEKCQALLALKKAKITGFSHLTKAPDWLERSISILSMSDYELKNDPDWIKTEFVDKTEFCQEFFTQVLPDTTLLASNDFRGLLFSIY
eukprot:gene8174-11059_t